MQETKFLHRVSKGSRYNQIYVPKEMQDSFDVGDLVEVRILEKKNKLYYSNNLKKLNYFKEKLIKEIFKFLGKFKEIDQVFIVGSFLTKKVEYNDIDIFILTKRKEEEKLDKKIYDELSEELNLKFHVISGIKEKLIENLKFSPLMRSMFSRFISNKKFELPKETVIDENEIKHHLMMPEDLLKVSLDDGKVYHNALRTLVTVENFLKKQEIMSDKIDDELINLMDDKKLTYIRNGARIKGAIKKELNILIKEKLNSIYKILKNVKKR